jgi:hypothetical protein
MQISDSSTDDELKKPDLTPPIDIDVDANVYLPDDQLVVALRFRHHLQWHCVRICKCGETRRSLYNGLARYVCVSKTLWPMNLKELIIRT